MTLCPFSAGAICTDDGQNCWSASMDQGSGPTVLVTIVFFTTAQLEGEKPVSLKNVLDKAVKIIILLKSWPMCAYIAMWQNGEWA